MAKNSMTEASDASKRQELTFRRRDMLEAEKVANEPFSQLFTSDGEATALGALAMQYVMEKRAGVTESDWEDWLDEEVDDVEVDWEGEAPS